MTIAAVPIKLADAEFIAMARNIFPAMLDVIEAAEVVSHENSPAELWDRLDAALARVRDLIGADDE